MRYGQDRVVSDAVASAYMQPFLWKELVERCGTFDVPVLQKNIAGTTCNGPGGTITIHRNHHAFKPALIGRVNADLQFDIVWQSPEWIRPLPWLGLERVDFTAKGMIMDALAAFPQTLSFSDQPRQPLLTGKRSGPGPARPLRRPARQ